VNDTPRTDAAEYESQDEPAAKLGAVDVEFARTLERELNAANAIIRQQQLLEEENLRLQDRIKRLEEAGNMLEHNNGAMAQQAWRKTKEAKP
jgi:hypothetical protein